MYLDDSSVKNENQDSARLMGSLHISSNNKIRSPLQTAIQLKQSLNEWEIITKNRRVTNRGLCHITYLVDK